MNHARKRIALLFTASNFYYRDVAAGVAAHVARHGLDWELIAADLSSCSIEQVAQWRIEGIIAEMDQPQAVHKLAAARACVVGVGSASADTPPGPFSMAGSDNLALVKKAYRYLVEQGAPHLAMYSLPPAHNRHWAVERERAFARLCAADGAVGPVYHGHEPSVLAWESQLEELVDWLVLLPKPAAVLAVNDARARHLLQACAAGPRALAGSISIVGIDNDPLVHTLARVPISSVMHATDAIGRAAASLLHQDMLGLGLGVRNILLPPSGMNGAAPREGAHGEAVARALHFIDLHATDGIKAEQVARHVGLSRSWLERQFQRELGHSLHDAIFRRRLDAAKAMLLHGHGDLAEVAARCGYSSVQYLYGVFARELGCTPRDFRQRGQPDALQNPCIDTQIS
ncbi:AraC family transcriptional regulator [Pseudoduganella lutea]|nr:substrate-binding domain-containing protein [Pseudoduganella lutea]